MDQPKPTEFFFEIFDASLPRLGPGNDAATVRALQTLLTQGRPRRDAPGPSSWRILDFGCGNGAPTIQLAKHLDAAIVAVDFHQPFLDELRRRAEAEGVAEKIQTWCRDLRGLDLESGSFDLVWAEGSLFATGFREGLTACHAWLAPGGLMAATELCWFSPDPPAECRRFFANGYPAMTDVETNLATIKACGYELIGHFRLPESAWWDSFYHPLEDRLRSFRARFAADAEKLTLIESIQAEIDLYRRYSRFYGYVFFMMQRG